MKAFYKKPKQAFVRLSFVEAVKAFGDDWRLASIEYIPINVMVKQSEYTHDFSEFCAMVRMEQGEQARVEFDVELA